MRRCLGAAVVFGVMCMSITAGRGEVDLTPIPGSNVADGVTESYVTFRDGKREIIYRPPQGWRLNGSGQKLTLTSNAAGNTDARIEVRSVAAVIPIDQANVQKYVAIAQQAVPREARNLQVVSSTINPLKICGYDTLAIGLQYEAFGLGCRSQLLYLNRDREQWVFQFTAPVNAFERAFEPFRMSLYTLMGL